MIKIIIKKDIMQKGWKKLKLRIYFPGLNPESPV